MSGRPNAKGQPAIHAFKYVNYIFLALIRAVLHAVHRLLQPSQTHRAINNTLISQQEWPWAAIPERSL
jgi:hypothetical protein